MPRTWNLLVLQSGGVRGAVSVGSLAPGLKAIEDAGETVDGIFGSSTGALSAGYLGQANSVMPVTLAVLRQDLEHIYREDIGGNDDVVNVLWPGGLLGKARGLAEAGGIYRFKPLAKLLEQHLIVWGNRGGPETQVGVVGLETGRFLSIRPMSDAAPTLPRWRTAILASSAAPMMAGAIEFDGEHYVDGGVMEITPLRPALAWAKSIAGPDDRIRLWVFCTGPLAPRAATPQNGFQMLMRALELHGNAVVRKDLDRIERENVAVLEGRADPDRRAIEVVVYEPREYGPKAYDFDPKAIRVMLEQGRAVEPWRGVVR